MYYTDEARSYGKKLSEDFTSFKKSLQVEITPEIRAEYFKKHLDKKQFFEVDKGLMEKIVSFYNESSAEETFTKDYDWNRYKKNKQILDEVFEFIRKKSLAENDIKELLKEEKLNL